MRYSAASPGRLPQAVAEGADSAPAREPRVVHQSYGRLRVHLPYWDGERGEEISAGLRRLLGVTHAEASPLTGNVLLLFDPRQTTARALLEALPALRLEAPIHLRVFREEAGNPAQTVEVSGGLSALGQSLEPHPANPVAYMTGTGRVIYKALGWASVGMAVVGAALPGIPTAPFVVLAGYFFVRSSPEAHQWLRQSRWFGTLLRDWEEHRGVRRSVRNAAAGLIGAGMALTPFLGLPTALVATIIPLQLIGLAIVLRLRVIDAPAPAVAIQAD
jgi:uncharacterized membrane protein YbaN (DUF454 family)